MSTDIEGNGRTNNNIRYLRKQMSSFDGEGNQPFSKTRYDRTVAYNLFNGHVKGNQRSTIWHPVYLEKMFELCH